MANVTAKKIVEYLIGFSAARKNKSCFNVAAHSQIQLPFKNVNPLSKKPFFSPKDLKEIFHGMATPEQVSTLIFPKDREPPEQTASLFTVIYRNIKSAKETRTAVEDEIILALSYLDPRKVGTFYKEVSRRLEEKGIKITPQALDTYVDEYAPAALKKFMRTSIEDRGALISPVSIIVPSRQARFALWAEQAFEHTATNITETPMQPHGPGWHKKLG